MRALGLHLHEATSLFQLSRDPRTFVALGKAIDTLTFAQNVCRGSVTFMVFALMGFPDESAPPPSHVASSLQISRSKLRHAHKGDTPLFHHVDHHALESAMSRVLGRWSSYPGQLMINGMQRDHSWASGFAALPHQLRGHPSEVRAGPDRREERPMGDLVEDVDGLPNISGSEERIRQASRSAPVFLPQGVSGFGEITSCASYLVHPFSEKG